MPKYKVGQIVWDILHKTEAMVLALIPFGETLHYVVGHTDTFSYVTTKCEYDIASEKPKEVEVEELTVEQISERLGKTIKVVK